MVNLINNKFKKKNEFADLLQKAKGTRSINQYAFEAGISPAHISRLLRCMLDTAPSPDTLLKLANHAHNDVTYNDFMEVSGYINNDIELRDNIKCKEKIRDIENKVIATISIYLRCDENIESIKFCSYKNIQCNMIAEFKDNTKQIFNFIFDLNINKLLEFLGYISTIYFEKYEEVFIVVTSFEDYSIIIKNKPVSLNINVSVMNVDVDKFIVKEQEKIGLFQ